MLHRDLKPGNIMLGKFGETLVVDWGLAKSRGPARGRAGVGDDGRPHPGPRVGQRPARDRAGARLGTPAYMSPEQAAGRIADLGPASDVYSLGATLYCLLTGQAPFADPDMAELLRKVERGDFPPPRKLKGWIDPALEAICLKAMATDPADRYRTPRALADDVEHWLADEPVSAWREPIRRRLRRWGRRHRLLVTGLAATLSWPWRRLASATCWSPASATSPSATSPSRAPSSTRCTPRWRTSSTTRRRWTTTSARSSRRRSGSTSGSRCRRAVTRRCGWRRLERNSGGRDPVPAGADRGGRAGLSAGLRVLNRLVSDHPAEAAYRDALAQAHQSWANFFEREERWREA